MKKKSHLKIEEIRSPDESKIEQLIRDNRTDEEKELDEVLYQSLQDFHKINEDYEQNIIKNFETQLNSRKTQFNDLINNLARISKYDNDVRTVFDIIEPIVESYCMSYLEVYEFDEITYNKIFKTISSIRGNKSGIESLKTIMKLKYPL